MQRLGKSLLRAWPSVLSGVLLLLAFPPFDLWPLLFVGLIPWLRSLKGLDGKAAWRSGYALGFVYGLGQLLWVEQFVGKWLDGSPLALLPWGLATVLYALYFGWTGVLAARAYRRGWLWLIPLFWIGIEAFRSYIPVFAFPWGLLATPLWKAPALIQLARFGTIYGISGLIVAVNVVLGEVEGRRLPWRAVAGLTVLFAVSVGLYLMPASGRPYRVAAVQPGVDVAFGTPDQIAQQLDQSLADRMAEAEAQSPSLVVLPEGMMDVPMMPPSPTFPVSAQAATLIGGRRKAEGKVAYQSAFLFDGAKWQFEDKTRLVIFGEFVPFRDIFPALAESFRLPAGDLVPGGDGVRSLDAKGTRVGPILCFEALFPNIAYQHAMNGSRVLAVMSIDDWFFNSSAPDQLKAGSVWRAVETGLPVIRSASLGYTFAVDPRGRITAEVPKRGSRVLVTDLLVPDGPPTFPGLPLLPYACAVLLFALTLYPVWGKRSA